HLVSPQPPLPRLDSPSRRFPAAPPWKAGYMQDAVLLSDPPVTDVTKYFERGGGAGFRRALGLGPGATIQEVILSGLRGRGGGGFPTGRKWQSVSDTAGGDRTFVVCNGAEGEPATFKGRAIMRANPSALVER